MKNVCLFAFLLFSLSTFSQAELNGVWETGDENTRIEIADVEGQWVGKILSSDNQKAIIGKVILKDLKQDDSGWTGRIYAARRQEWYDVEISPKENVLELEVKVGLFSKSLDWKRDLGERDQ